jgi:hypothetical protein
LTEETAKLLRLSLDSLYITLGGAATRDCATEQGRWNHELSICRTVRFGRKDTAWNFTGSIITPRLEQWVGIDLRRVNARRYAPIYQKPPKSFEKP